MRRLTLILMAAMITLSLNAQVMDVCRQVAENYDKAAGCEGPYRYDAPALTKSPKGYKPFYISHYGRHGSRYSWTGNTYTVILNTLRQAKQTDALTAQGQKLYDAYMSFYETPLINTGDLSELGWEQHTNIAAKIVSDFPELFKRGASFTARASTSQRAITSMAAFLVSLQKNAPDIKIVGNSLHTNMPVINPPGAPIQLQKRYDRPSLPSSASLENKRSAHYEDILSRLFTDTSFFSDRNASARFLNELFAFWEGYENYCTDGRFEGIFTTEEIVDFWEVENYGTFSSQSIFRYTDIPLLQDIVDCANLAIEGKGTTGDFRFGHDTVLNAIVPLLNLDGCGFIPEDAEDIKYWFQNYNCPMASNIQIVLYRSRKNPEILFKVLRNGAEASLPQLTAVSGPYYRWSDFMAWAETIYAEHPVL